MKTFAQFLFEDDFLDQINQDTILVNGTQRSTKNNLGKFIALDTESIIEFYNWFGESKMVDSSGSPIILYFSKYDKETGQTWLTSKPDLTKSSSKQKTVYLNVQSIYKTTFDDDQLDVDLEEFTIHSKYDCIQITEDGVSSYVVVDKHLIKQTKDILDRDYTPKSFSTFTGV